MRLKKIFNLLLFLFVTAMLNAKIVLQDLARKCHMLSAVTDVSNPNGFSAASAFYDGKRAAFLDILKMSACDDQKLIALLQETERNKNES